MLLILLLFFVPLVRALAAVPVIAIVGYLLLRARRASGVPSVAVASSAVPATRPARLPLATTFAPAPARRSAPPARLPYRARGTFFNWSEAAFYGALVTAIGGRYLVFAKVRLLDICADLERSQLAAFNRISSKHLDFLLCDPVTYRPTVGIELDGPSHLRRDRIERDAFVDEVFRGMNVPLIHFRVERSFLPQQIAQRIGDVTGG